MLAIFDRPAEGAEYRFDSPSAFVMTSPIDGLAHTHVAGDAAVSGNRWLVAPHGVAQELTIGDQSRPPVVIFDAANDDSLVFDRPSAFVMRASIDPVVQAQHQGDSSARFYWPIAAHGLAQEQANGVASLGTKYLVTVNGLTHDQRVLEPALRLAFQIETHGLFHRHALDRAPLSTNYRVTVHGLAHEHRLSLAPIGSKTLVFPHGLAQANALGTISLGMGAIQVHRITSHQFAGAPGIYIGAEGALACEIVFYPLYGESTDMDIVLS